MRIVAIMVVRGEVDLLETNLRYHVKHGFDQVVVAIHLLPNDRLAPDEVRRLERLRNALRPAVELVSWRSAGFDQRQIQQTLIDDHISPKPTTDDVIFPLDVDEFVWARSGIRTMVEGAPRRASAGQFGTYAALLHLNMLHDIRAARPYPHALDSSWGYYPRMERSWEMPSSLYKSFVTWHEGIEVFQGGHFFPSMPGWPETVEPDVARIYHYSQRGTPTELLEKWRALSAPRLSDPPSPLPPWWEKYDLLAERVRRYENDPELLEREWFHTPRTFWGTELPASSLIYSKEMRELLLRVQGS